MSKTLRNAALALLALGAFTVPAHAIPGRIGQGMLATLPSGGHLADGAFTAAPNAFNVFCEDYNDQCASTGAPGAVKLDADRWAELETVNSHVNRTIRPQPDAPGTDVWTIGASEGDCDDYTVEKRKELLDLGWPSSALSLSVAFIRSGEAHLLLVARTDRGDFALDNLRSRVIAADRTGYRWVARQSTIHPRLWVRIDGVADEAVQVAEAPKPAPVAAKPAKPVQVAAAKPVQVAAAPARGKSKSVAPAAAPVVLAAAKVPAPVVVAPQPTPIVEAQVAVDDVADHFSQISVDGLRLAAAASEPAHELAMDLASLPLTPIRLDDIGALFDPMVVGTTPVAHDGKIDATSAIR